MPEPFALYEARATSLAPLIGYADGYLTEEHERQVHVTRFPLESGATLGDHAVRTPDTVKLTGWTSDLYPSDASLIPETDRPAQAWAEIDRLMSARELLHLVTVLGLYPDMLIVRALAPVSTRTGRGLYFTLELQHIQTAPLRRVEFVIRPAPNTPAVDRVLPVGHLREGDDDLAVGEQYSLTAEEVWDLGSVANQSFDIVQTEGAAAIQQGVDVGRSALDNGIAQLQAGQIVPGLGTLASGLGSVLGTGINFVQATGAKVAAVKDGATSTRSALLAPDSDEE